MRKVAFFDHKIAEIDLLSLLIRQCVVITIV
jgi:hypothetical protein